VLGDPRAHAPPGGLHLVSRGEDGAGEVPPPERPLRILAFITMWDPNAGGVVAVNRQLCEALAAEGHDVYVRVGHTPPDIRIDGIHLIGPRVVDPGIDSRYQLVGGYEDLPGQIDAVIGHSRFSGPAARQVRDEVYPGAELVHFVHMAPEALGRVQGKPPEVIAENVTIERDLVQHADLAVGVGPRLADEVRSLAQQGSADGHMPVVHELTPGVEIVDRVPHTGQDPLKIVYLLGRADDAQKGVIQAAEMVRSLGPENARLVVRGVDPKLVEAQQRQLSEIAGAPVDVRPYSIVHAELVSDLQEADVLVMPSRAEGFGLVALEAAGAGVPVLVPSTSGAGMFFADPARFPADLTEHSLIEQGFEEPVPVARWTDELKAILDDIPAAQRRALDIQQRLRESDVTWRAAARSLVDEIRQLEPRPDPAPRQGSSIIDALRVEIVRPAEHDQVAAGQVTHEPPPQFARIGPVIREADHLLVEITDGQRTTTMRIDVDMAARRVVVSSLDPNGAWLRDMARRAQTPDGMFDLFGHADEYGFVINGVHVAFGDMAQFLRDLPESTTIRLCGCEVGRGDAVVALAHEAQQVVRVANRQVFEDTSGNVFACSAVEGPDGLIRLVPDRNGEADGMWTDVYPDGHRGDPVQDGFPVTSVLADGDVVLRLAPGDYFRDVTMFGPKTEGDLRLPPRVRDFAGDSGYPGPHSGVLVARDGVAYDQDRLAAFNVRLMGFSEDAIGDGARWIRVYFDGDPQARGAYKSVLDAIAASRAERRAARTQYQQEGLSQAASAAKLRGEGPDIREPGRFINEVAVMHDNVYLGADSQGWGHAPFELERVKLHGIPVEAQYLWGRDAARMFVKSFPDRQGGYPDIAVRLDGYRATYSGGDPRRAAEFGQRYADAMLELVRGDRGPADAADGYPELLQELSRSNGGRQAFAEITRIGLQDAHCLPLHELAIDTFGLPKYMEFYRRIMGSSPVDAFQETEVGRFLQEAASLTFLNIGLEGARHPENFFTGLMTWHLVADGRISLDDALGHFNVMGPQGAGLISRWADWMNGWTYDGHPGSRPGWPADQPAKYVNGIPEPPDSLPAAAEEMRRREREIVALYAYSRGEGLFDALNQAFFGNGVPADPQLRERMQMGALRSLIDYLLTRDMRWPPSLELFRPQHGS
jgi:glycosyltransferase involved in cell wall biosynthesis